MAYQLTHPLTKILYFAALLLGTAGVLSGCGKTFQPNNSSQSAAASAAAAAGMGSTTSSTSVSAAGLQAFQSGLYTFVNNQGCVKCHASIVHPNFAASDINVAYAAAKGSQIGSSAPLVDFNNPTASIFITYAGNGHCNDTPCSDPTVRPTVQADIVAWAQAELSSGGASSSGSGSGSDSSAPSVATYLTDTMALPTTIPAVTAKGTPALLRFQLSKLTPAVASLSKAVLEIEIEMDNTTEYRVTNPRIDGASASVQINGIHIYIRPSSGTGVGTEDTGQGNLWDSAMSTVAASALPNPLPTGPFTGTALETTALDIQSQSAADSMTIGFDNVQ